MTPPDDSALAGAPPVACGAPAPFSQLAQAACAYAADAWQRALLVADIERQVGDQYQAQRGMDAPHVLHFEFEPVMSGAELPRPVNYGLVRILPSEGRPTEAGMRPFVVVDPRAGQGPGIGGFKAESEVGAALQAGHPCYFVGFTPDPVPGQTVEDVMRAEAAFLRRVAELHPDSAGKPAVVANCQAGWQILMTAAVWPELFGPIIAAGSPLSYWAGDNPMRYGGGLTGGSWLTALGGDLGAGRFDGAWMVQNFENLDPANTLWKKHYHLYANADTEGRRYLEFEKYWGGYVFLNDVEMQYIVDNLFIGNKLSTAQLLTSDGVRIDLRNIRSPILVFCSYGDNITPPAQALGWITDLYRDDRDLLGHDQTIVYATHDSIGHLGIFVSGAVGDKEHRKFASAIEQIELLPAGIFHATVKDTPPGSLLQDPHLLGIRRSSIDEVRAIVQPDAASERRFAAAARVSEINLALYRSLLQPWVRAWATPQLAQALQTLHPMRVSFAHWSSSHPLAPRVQALADSARTQRVPVTPDNPFVQWQEQVSLAIERALDAYRTQRDEGWRIAFETLYGSPWLQALTGGDAAAPVRPHPGESPEHRAFIRQVESYLQQQLHVGGLPEAALRALFYIFGHCGEMDERLRHEAARLLHENVSDHVIDTSEHRRVLREQALIVLYHGPAIVDALPAMLRGTPARTLQATARFIEQLVHSSGGGLTDQGEQALALVLDALATAIAAATATNTEAEASAPATPVHQPPTKTTRPSPRVKKKSYT